jgi:flagellar hook-associated protein 3 FlgL
MRRVSTDLMNNDMQFWLRRGERDMASLETRMATQQKIEKLRDDPLGAARAVRFDSAVERLKRYEENARMAGDESKLAEGYVREATDVAQRLREIAVQGANGVYTKEDQKAMAIEVDQLIGELVSLGNARAPDGTYVFSGAASQTEPFREVRGRAAGAGTEVTTEVQYLGGWNGPRTEVAEGESLPLRQPGSDVFWAERQEVLSSFDGRDWKAKADGAIAIDGIRIDIRAGDNIQSLAARINESGAPVKATIDPRRFSLNLQATLPHQMRLEDLPSDAAPALAPGSGGTLAELGILAGTGRPPDNLAPSARTSGGSLFDVAIRLRDSLNRGDVLETGGLALAGIDAGLDNLNRRVTEIGSRSERLDFIASRLNKEIPDATRMLASETDLDVTKAVTDYRMLEYAHRASLGFAGRLFPQTLLDFLR